MRVNFQKNTAALFTVFINIDLLLQQQAALSLQASLEEESPGTIGKHSG
tara:strand:+ start:7632 stop:7778 length:147 start_codon:yes stop_codon:yes gene_type:complete